MNGGSISRSNGIQAGRRQSVKRIQNFVLYTVRQQEKQLTQQRQWFTVSSFLIFCTAHVLHFSQQVMLSNISKCFNQKSYKRLRQGLKCSFFIRTTTKPASRHLPPVGITEAKRLNKADHGLVGSAVGNSVVGRGDMSEKNQYISKESEVGV